MTPFQRYCKQKELRARMSLKHAPVKIPGPRKRIRSTAGGKVRRDNLNMLPFAAVDGEGVGRGGAHRYVLFRIGDRELYNGDQRLTTPDLLEFILATPPDFCLVGFALEYDFTHICRDIPYTDENGKPSRMARLMKKEDQGRPKVDPDQPYAEDHAYTGTGWTWVNFDGYGQYGLDYLPRNYLKVCRAIDVEIDGRLRTIAEPGSIRSIYDTFGFFQSSFLKALNSWDVGREHWAEIKRQKDSRATFEAITPEIAHYCRVECDLLTEMMEKFRAVCISAGIVPKTWNGAGKLASTILRKHEVMKRKELARKFRKQPGVLNFAHAAYYGGRFEVTRVGRICGPVWENDLISAYPSAMRKLPCLLHTKWRKVSAQTLRAIPLYTNDSQLFVCHAKFRHPADAFLCGLPIREKSGRLIWPREGHGIYWSPEIVSAISLGASVELGDGWLAERDCDCKVFPWVEELFEERRRIGKSTRGYPIKLGLNSLYGKFAQRIGYAPYQNPIWAGLITAYTRAALNNVIASFSRQAQADIVMLATDGIYTLRPPPKLRIGERLGQWEQKEYPELFIVRPGLWWPPKTKEWRVKSRGVSAKFFEPVYKHFEREWRKFARRQKGLSTDGPDLLFMEFPEVPVSVDLFIGMRLAYHRVSDKLKKGVALSTGEWKAGTWETADRVMSFRWTDKRMAYLWLDDQSIITFPRQGDIATGSMVYDPKEGLGEVERVLELDRMELEAQPDPVELSIIHVIG